jgi:LytTr DNA-binding domain
MWKEVFKPQHQHWRWLFCILQSVYFEIFSYLYQPYKGDYITYVWASPQDFVSFNLLHFATIFFFCFVSSILLPHFFPIFFIPERFTITRFAGLIFSTGLFIALVFFYIYHIYFQSPMTLDWLLIFLFKLTPTNIFFVSVPFIIICLLVFNHFTLSENNKYDAVVKNKLTENENTPPQYNDLSAPILLTFTDTSNKKMFQVLLDKLYYIVSAQNYVEIIYQNDKAEQARVVMRNSLKAIEEDMMENSNISLIRCHKAYIVNSEKIIEMRGSSKTGQLILKDVDTAIPVSRQKYAEYKSLFPTSTFHS